MKLRSLIAAPVALVAAGLFLSACGQSQVPGTAQISAAAAIASPSLSSPPAAPPAAKTAAANPFEVARAGSLGVVLVGANGHTLYAFTKDADGVSTCFDACAAAWPAATVPAGDVSVPSGVDPTLVTTVQRPDGTRQLKIGKWPMYFYAGDGAPGETNGQAVGGVWFAEGTDGGLIKDGTAGREAQSTASPAESAPAPAALPVPGPAPAADPTPTDRATGAAPPVVALAQVGNLGQVMVGANGHTLYAFTDDPEKQSSCFDACAKAWPPLTVEDGFNISDELQSSGVTTIERPDGTRQLVMGKWALYYYTGDAAPGDANGQGSAGKWFAVDANCKLVKRAA